MPRLGRQTPRVAQFPDYDRSAAPEIIDLAAAAGLVLDDWQQYVLTHGLGELSNERWSSIKIGTWVPRQNGKGGIIEALELGWLFLLREPLVLHSAHEYKTSSEAFRRVKYLIDNCSDLARRVDHVWEASGMQGIEIKPRWGGCRLRFVARSRKSLRGFSGDKVVLDEAQELSAEEMAAIMPTMSARPNPQLWFFGTPPSDGSAWCYDLRADGESGAKRVAWFDWGADIDIADPHVIDQIENRDNWYATNPALGIRIDEQFVEDELLPSGLGAHFIGERLGVWPPRTASGAMWQVVDEAAWTALHDKNSAIVGDVTYSLDVSPMRTCASIGVAGARADGTAHVEIADWRTGVDWITWWFTSRQIKRVVLDSRGAAGFAELLRDAGIEVLSTNGEQLAAASGQFVDACAPRTAGLRHLAQPLLDAALAGATTRALGGAWTWDRRQVATDITPLVAVTLALWGHNEQGRPKTSSVFESRGMVEL